MQDLQEVTQDLHYENFRSEHLKRGGRLSSHGYVLPLSPVYVLLCSVCMPFCAFPNLHLQNKDQRQTTRINIANSIKYLPNHVLKNLLQFKNLQVDFQEILHMPAIHGINNWQHSSITLGVAYAVFLLYYTFYQS